MLLTTAQMTHGWKHSYTPALCMLVNQNHSLHTPHFSIQGNMHAKRLIYTSMFSLYLMFTWGSYPQMFGMQALNHQSSTQQASCSTSPSGELENVMIML